MISKIISQTLRKSNTLNLVNNVPKMSIGHIKSMWDENLKHQVEKVAQTPLLETTNRIYKPTYPIEFNREGEVVLYSCEPLKHSTVYFKYPYVMYEAMMPIYLFNFVFNPFELEWYWCNMSLMALYVSWIPRMWYWRSLGYKIQKLSLLRGGRVAKIETQNLSNDRFTSWVETYQFHPLTADQKNFADRDNADFLEEEGQLKHELSVQLDHVQEMGTTSQDIVFNFMKEGVVHHPEIFEAVVKGFNIDTSDYVINTANNSRAREGNYSQ